MPRFTYTRHITALLSLTLALAACAGEPQSQAPAPAAQPAASATTQSAAPAAATAAQTAAPVATVQKPPATGGAALAEGQTAEGYWYLGNADAPVTLTMYSDFL